MVAMVEQKILGNKTRGGFYKRTKEGIQTFDPVKLEYRAKAGDESIKKFCKSLKGSPADRVKALPTRPTRSARSPTTSRRSMTP
jgi:3-hydroxyacyl-CoA dehydrogenase